MIGRPLDYADRDRDRHYDGSIAKHDCPVCLAGMPASHGMNPETRAACPGCGEPIYRSDLTVTGWTHVRPMTTRQRADFHKDGRDPRPDPAPCRWTDGTR